MTPLPIRLLLHVAGWLLFLIGVTILLDPHAVFASNGIPLSTNPDLLSEIRAPGGLLTAAAIVMVRGALRHDGAHPALLVGMIVYGSYGVARVVAMALDGPPATPLIAVTVLELVVAILCAAARTRLPSRQSGRPATADVPASRV